MRGCGFCCIERPRDGYKLTPRADLWRRRRFVLISSARALGIIWHACGPAGMKGALWVHERFVITVLDGFAACDYADGAFFIRCHCFPGGNKRVACAKMDEEFGRMHAMKRKKGAMNVGRTIS